MSIQDIQSLSDAEKILLVEQIWDSIHKQSIEITSEQKDELDKRLENHKSGKTRYSSWDEVKNRLQD